MRILPQPTPLVALSYASLPMQRLTSSVCNVVLRIPVAASTTLIPTSVSCLRLSRTPLDRVRHVLVPPVAMLLLLFGALPTAVAVSAVCAYVSICVLLSVETDPLRLTFCSSYLPAAARYHSSYVASRTLFVLVDSSCSVDVIYIWPILV